MKHSGEDEDERETHSTDVDGGAIGVSARHLRDYVGEGGSVRVRHTEVSISMGASDSLFLLWWPNTRSLRYIRQAIYSGGGGVCSF